MVEPGVRPPCAPGHDLLLAIIIFNSSSPKGNLVGDPDLIFHT